MGCHFLLQCVKVKSEREVTQSCLTLSDPMDCSLPDSSVHGIFQARVLKWGAIAFSTRHNDQPSNGTKKERPRIQEMSFECMSTPLVHPRLVQLTSTLSPYGLMSRKFFPSFPLQMLPPRVSAVGNMGRVSDTLPSLHWVCRWVVL